LKDETKLVAAIFFIALICGLSVADGAEQIRLKLSAPKVDFFDVPVHVEIELPKALANLPVEAISVELRDANATEGKAVPGQLVVNDRKDIELWWILPVAKANSSSTWIATLDRGQKTREEARLPRDLSVGQDFSWKGKSGQYLDLLFNGRRVTRYMYACDTSNPQRIFETCKPFLHVFDAEGKNLLTNGPDGIHPYQKDKILYPHHRGIFIGWTKLEFAGDTYNFWGMADGVVQRHGKFLEQTAGPVLARSKVLIHWNDKDSKPIIAEQRQTTVFRQSLPAVRDSREAGDPTILLLDFQTELKAVRGDVFLNGDPEHGGFQYRAHNDVAAGNPQDGLRHKDDKAAYLFHNDGIDAHKDSDLPWAAMSYGLNGRRYTVQHMNHPGNPKSTFYSANRDYGRFGAFFKQKIDAGKTLTLRYRIWIGEGPPFLLSQKARGRQRQELENKYAAFVEEPKVEVLSQVERLDKGDTRDE